jgi:hypothetical protein
MEKEFNYKPNNTSYVQQGVASGENTMKSMQYQPQMQQSAKQYTEITNSTPVRSYENSTETHGTYRARTNGAYDNTDNSLENPTRFSPLNMNARPRVDHDEYWRTNI